MKTADYRRMVTVARDAARDEARSACPKGIVQTRGAWMIVRDDKDALTHEYDIAYKGSIKQIEELKQRFPNATYIDVDGGFDWGENKQAFEDGTYEAWVSEWSVSVWTKQQQ
jgi:hypothetical protein